MTPLFRQLLELSTQHDDVFQPEGAARVRENPGAAKLAAALGERSMTDALLIALRALCAQRDEATAERLEMELVATTPGFTSSVARETEEVLFELVDAAKHQLIAVGYFITSEQMLARMHRAADRNVEVVIISDRSSGHGEDIINGWPRSLRVPRVYREKQSDVNAMAKMHGKALLADGERLFISSANFTWLALHANIELGVLLSGPGIRTARVLFEELFLESGLLERIALR